jgi:hypothetical protein
MLSGRYDVFVAKGALTFEVRWAILGDPPG